MKPFLQVAQDNEQSQWLPERIEAGRWSHTVTRVKPLTVLTAPVAREGAAGSGLIPGLPRLHLRATSSCILGEEDSCSPASSLGHSWVLPLTCPSLPFPYLQGTWRGFRSSPEPPSDAATSSPRSCAADPDLSNPDTSGPGRRNLQTLMSPELTERSKMLKEQLEGEGRLW